VISTGLIRDLAKYATEQETIDEVHII